MPGILQELVIPGLFRLAIRQENYVLYLAALTFHGFYRFFQSGQDARASALSYGADIASQGFSVSRLLGFYHPVLGAVKGEDADIIIISQ
ncbi:hypothetical protein SDC9_153767 [bioreactor metagenome]|uniref:Uncharacterized protein n=1 Tax=bioreactor metagenome TaxID=1076179 RepID=A0A645EWV7_9ZZZZ